MINKIHDFFSGSPKSDTFSNTFILIRSTLDPCWAFARTKIQANKSVGLYFEENYKFVQRDSGFLLGMPC